MALKDLIVKRRSKPRPSPANVIIAVLKRCGVRAPVNTAESITEALRAEGYDFQHAPRRERSNVDAP